MLDKYLYIEEADLDNSVYRIFNAGYFFDLATREKNTLVRPKKWDDPFENYFLKLPIETKKGAATNRHKKMVYGQCWTLTEESDALWRIYSPCKTGIKVKTSIVKLYNSFVKGFDESHKRKHSYIGKVQYYDPEANDIKNLEDKFEKTEKFSLGGRLEAVQLLFKRNAFSYENEIRIIGYFLEKNPSAEMICYEVNPFELFSEIVLDPRLSNDEFAQMKEKLVQIGFNDRIISKSNLYKFNESELRVLKHNYD